MHTNTPPPPSTGPLAGIRVLDLSAVLLGPVATQILADFGADVIKIEPPEGDLMRANGVTQVPGLSSIFVAANRNKRSVVLDLKTEDGAAALRHLVAGADVLVHNMRIEAIERLGFGYAEVAAINPRIVYCVSTGFGQSGPHAGRPAFDDIIQAACGLVSANSRGQPQPDYVRTVVADKVTGLSLANAVLAAVVHQTRHGQGQYVEVPMLETMAAFVLTEHMGGLAFEGSTAPAGYARVMDSGRKPWPTQDSWICMLPYSWTHWQALFQALDRSDVVAPYRIDNRSALNAIAPTLNAALLALTPTRTTAQWAALCEQVDIPATPVYRMDDLPEHPQLQAVGLFEWSEHPVLGRIRQVRPATLFERTPATLRSHAPTLGQHTAEVLREAGVDTQLRARLALSTS